MVAKWKNTNLFWYTGDDDTLTIIKNLNMDKADGLRMIKMITFPYKLIFKSINECVFPEEWKKSNVFPVHKKE